MPTVRLDQQLTVALVTGSKLVSQDLAPYRPLPDTKVGTGVLSELFSQGKKQLHLAYLYWRNETGLARVMRARGYTLTPRLLFLSLFLTGAACAQIQSGGPYNDTGYTPATSGTTVGPESNSLTLPPGLTTSQINTILGTANISVRFQPSDDTTPFTNTNYDPVIDNRTNIPAAPWNVKASGAACDAQLVTATADPSSTLITFSGVTLQPSDTGKWVETTGLVGSTPTRFDATITYASATTATLSTAPVFTSGSGSVWRFGHQDDAALAAAVTLGIDSGREIDAPNGTCWSATPIRFGANIIGQGTMVGGSLANQAGSAFMGSAGEDVFQSLDPSQGGFSPFPGHMHTRDYSIFLDPTIDATQPWQICGPSTACTAQTPLYRPIDILGPLAQDPLAPQWIQGSGQYNTGAINGVAAVTNSSAVMCVPSTETLPAIGSTILFPYQASASTPMFSTTVSSHSGSGCAGGTDPVTLGAAYTPPTAAQVEWFAGTSFQTIQKAIPATGRTFPITLTLSNPITPTPFMSVGQAQAGVGPFGLVEINSASGTEQCVYYGNSNLPASSTATPSITIRNAASCSLNGTSPLLHNVGSLIFPLNPLQPTWPWPVTPTLTSNQTTPTNAEFYPALGVGNAGISFPVQDGGGWNGDNALNDNGRVTDVAVYITPASSVGNAVGYQLQNDTAAVYFAIPPFLSTFENFYSDNTFYGIVEGMSGINTHGMANGFPSANGNVWRNIRIANAAYDLNFMIDSGGVFDGLSVFSQSYAAPLNYWPGLTIGSETGGQSALILDGFNDDETGAYPYNSLGVAFGNFQFKYLETETGGLHGFVPSFSLTCDRCTWNNMTPQGNNSVDVGGKFQQFIGGSIGAGASQPILNIGAHNSFQQMPGVVQTGVGSTYGSNAFLNWGPATVAWGPTDGATGGISGPQIQGNNMAPVTGQTEDTLAGGNLTVPYVAPGLGMITPDQLNASSALDPNPMTQGWTLDPTSPISGSYATCNVGNTPVALGCFPVHINGDYLYIGPGQKIVPGTYYGRVSFKTPSGAYSFTFSLVAQSAGACTGATVYTTTITSTDGNWHEYDIPTESLASYSGCQFSPSFGGSGTDEPIEVGYIDMIPLPNQINVNAVNLGGPGGPSFSSSGGSLILTSPGSAMLESGTPSNVDGWGELPLLSATTASYSFVNTYTLHPECVAEPQFDPGSGVRHWITYTSTTGFTVNFSSAVTGEVSYHCMAREAAPLGSVVDGWLMNEGTGTTLYTSSSTGNNLTASNITWGASAGFPGTVPQFNGTNSVAVGANQTATDFDGTAPFSVCAWINETSVGSSGSAIIGTLNSSANAYTGWELSQVNNSEPVFYLISSYSSNYLAVQSNILVTSNTINQICATYDGSRHASGATIYINGSSVSSSIVSDTLTASTANSNPVYVGERIDGSLSYAGAMGDVRIYNTRLTSAQVATLYALGPQ